MAFHKKTAQAEQENQKIRYGKNQSATFKPHGDETDPQEYKDRDGLAGTDKYAVDKK